MKQFLSDLNVRQLVIHFVATWLLIYGTHTLASLYDFKFLYNDYALQNSMIFKERFGTDMFIIKTTGYAGLITAYIISWQLAATKNWFWANSVIVFLFAFLLYYFNYSGWGKLQYIFLAPGQVFSGLSNAITIIFNGIIMLAMGLYLLLSKKVIAYISRGMKQEKSVI